MAAAVVIALLQHPPPGCLYRAPEEERLVRP